MGRWIVLVMTVCLLAGPGMATVTITAVDEGSGVVVISFSNDEATGKVRALALDIKLTGGAVITDVTDENTDYNIHPGSIVIDPCDPLDPGDGTISDYGSAVCDNSYPGTEAGIGTAGVTIEMASLYESVAPPQSGLLCRVTANADAQLTVSENLIRGGIVMENPALPSGDNLPVIVDVNVGICACKGDLVPQSPAPPYEVGTADAFYLVNILKTDVTPPLLKIVKGEPLYTLCGDLIDTGDPLGDVISTADAFFLIGYVKGAPGYKMHCLP